MRYSGTDSPILSIYLHYIRIVRNFKLIISYNFSRLYYYSLPYLQKWQTPSPLERPLLQFPQGILLMPAP